jgi:hypothetical protein
MEESEHSLKFVFCGHLPESPGGQKFFEIRTELSNPLASFIQLGVKRR